jgi:mono/diheme cytochrome c family protein
MSRNTPVASVAHSKVAVPGAALWIGLALAGCNRTLEPAAAAVPARTASAIATISGGDAAWLERGEYLVRMGGCNDCHTPGWNESAGQLPTAQWLVGSPLGYLGPWGTTYAANLRLRLTDMDEPTWLQYSANLHTRPLMPDFTIRAMREDDRRAIYRFVRSLGPTGQPAPAYLPPGRKPPLPYLELVLPPGPPSAPAAG